jgi:hypothetical protein
MMSEASQPAAEPTTETAGSVVMLSGDLMFASRVKSAAEHAGLTFRIGGSLPEDENDAIRFVVLDLSTRSGLTSAIAGQCSERCAQAKLIAYGPHVHVDRLKAARAAGIETVLTNGQFDAALPQLFSSD